MAVGPERILALDIDTTIVRGIVLAKGPQAVAGGYAQLTYEPTQGPAGVAARIAAALDVKATMPIVIACDESLGDSVAEQVAGEVATAGFTEISIVPREESMRRANPGGGPTDKLVDAEIASGLLTSHAGLTLHDLAPVVGAALGALGLGAPAIDDDEEPLAVWHPEAPPETDIDDDPFTVGTAASTAAATGAAAAAAATAMGQIDDDDPTELRQPGDAAAIDDDATTDLTTEFEDETVDLAYDTELADDTDLVDVTEGVVDYASLAEPVVDLTDASTASSAFDDGDETIPPEEVDPESAPVQEPEPEVASASAENPPGPTFVTAAASGPGPSFVTAAAAAVTKTEETPERKRSRGPLVALLVGLLAALVLGLFVLGGGGGDEVAGETLTAIPEGDPTVEPTAAPTTEPTAEPEAAAPQPAEVAEPTPAPEPTPVPTSTPVPTVAPEPAPTADPLEGLPPLSSLPERGAIFRPPNLFLEGPVPTQEQADELFARAAAVVGPDNVVNNYIVRPDAPEILDGNVRVEQAVLFETGSATLAEQFIPTLELGVAVMALNPQVTMVVEGHTDSVGDAEDNLELSERRAQAVVNYLESRGVEVERLQAVGLGETTPIADNDTFEGRQINRRIEVNLLDLLLPDS